MTEAQINRFGFPTRNQHVSMAACESLLKAAANESQLSIAISTIDRIALTPIQSRQAAPPSKEPAAACLAFYHQLAGSGQASQIVRVAALSSYFRQHYASAVKWAKSQTPIKP